MDKKIPKHIAGGAYLKDVIYGANDGIITTFAVVAGVAGAGLDAIVVVLLGAASLLADGFSMAASNYLGSRSEYAFFRRERRTEEIEFHHTPEEERAEMFGILLKKGYSAEDARDLIPRLFQNKELWLDIMMKEELGITAPAHGGEPINNAAATFVAFVGAGIVPLLPYIFAVTASNVFLVASFATGAALFMVGAARSRFTANKWIVEGVEMLLIGGAAAMIAYGVGYGVSVLV